MHTIFFALSLCAAFVMCHSAPIEESYDTVLANIHDTPYAERDGNLLEIPITYVDGKYRIYRRGIFDPFVRVYDTVVGAIKSVVKPDRYQIEYETSGGTEYKRNGVIIDKGGEMADTEEEGSFRYDNEDYLVMRMWTIGEGPHTTTKIMFRKKSRTGGINPKVVESLLG